MLVILREKLIGGVWVAPAIDDEGALHRVTLILQVGTRTDAPLRSITGEALDVRLVDAADTPLEQVERPGPGELAVQGGPSLQSTARFSFAPSGLALRRLTVTVNQETQAFDTQDVRPAERGFTDAPTNGDDFPISPPPRNVLERILAAIVGFFVAVGRFFKGIFDSDECCVTEFEAPFNRMPAGKRESFEMRATFSSNNDCECECCVYRQFVRGVVRDAAGDPIPFLFPDGPLDPAEYREDGVLSERGPGEHGFYGHRDAPARPADEYRPEMEDGCEYHGFDAPMCGATSTLHLEFLGLIVDTCQGRIKEVRAWVVDL